MIDIQIRQSTSPIHLASLSSNAAFGLRRVVEKADGPWVRSTPTRHFLGFSFGGRIEDPIYPTRTADCLRHTLHPIDNQKRTPIHRLNESRGTFRKKSRQRR
jgi:hypothetical protein